MTDRLAAAVAELVSALRDELAATATAPGPDRLYAIPEAAALLGVSRTALYDQLAAGRIRSVKVGRRRLVPGQAIRELTGEGGAS